jgi:hypothetical protein
MGFLSIDDLAASQGELGLCLEFNHYTNILSLEACTPLPEDTQKEDLAAAYLSLCDLDSPPFHSLFLSYSSTIDHTPAALTQHQENVIGLDFP